jgi:hypothetical protein
MGKRARKRSSGVAGEAPIGGGSQSSIAFAAANAIYTDADGNELELRGSLTVRARAEYAATLRGGLQREDAWQRAAELLFERLAVSWTIAGLRIDRQRELLGRYRMAGEAERWFVRDSLRAHVAEHFPEMEAP